MDDDDDRPGLARVDFSDDEERSLGRLASALGLVGTLQIVLSGLALVLVLIGFVMTLGNLSAALLLLSVLGVVYVGLPIFQGMLLREAGEALDKVAGSDEDDQEYLGSLFRRLRTVFVLELVLTVLHILKEST